MILAWLDSIWFADQFDISFARFGLIFIKLWFSQIFINLVGTSGERSGSTGQVGTSGGTSGATSGYKRWYPLPKLK